MFINVKNHLEHTVILHLLAKYYMPWARDAGASPKGWCCTGLPSGHKCTGFSQAAVPSAN